MRISDMIEQMISSMMDEDGVAEIQRNELAGQLHCVPSQINYVLSTRFSPENGYRVESRRGGGGYIRIYRVTLDHPSPLMHTVNQIGGQLDLRTAEALIKNLYFDDVLSEREASLLLSVVGDNALACAVPADRSAVRARLLKYALLTLAEHP